MLKIKGFQLTKKDISKKINLKIGLSLSYTDEITDNLLIILKNLIKNNEISIKNFGSFKILTKNERAGRNPRNKKIYTIKKRKSLSFKISRNLNNKINNIQMNKLINISELSRLLEIINLKTKKPLNYTLRYWEKEFKQIKPIIIKNRRYYSRKQINVIKLIKFLLKDKGMTINGVKNILKSNINSLDDYNSYSLKADYLKENIKVKSKTILEKIRKLKNGKKNSY